jgi:peroxiredoxin
MLLRVLPFALAIMLGLAAPSHADAQALDSRAPAPSLTVPALDGGRVDLPALRGQVVVISFWATWCRPCLQELPHLNALYEAHQAEGLQVLAISTDSPESIAQVRSISRRQRWTFRVLMDEDGSASQLLNPRGTNPFTVILDREGRIAWSREGFNAGDEVEVAAVVRQLLDEPAP